MSWGRRKRPEAAAEKPRAEVIRCDKCCSGWMVRDSIEAGIHRERAARCECLHRAVLTGGGSTGRIGCAQDRWGVGITQRELDLERDRVLAYKPGEAEADTLLVDRISAVLGRVEPADSGLPF